MRRISRIRTARLPICLVLLMVSFQPDDVLGFDSYGVFIAEHNEITTTAATNKGYAAGAIKWLKDFNRGVDWNETSTRKEIGSIKPFLGPNANYSFDHHFDRGKDNTGAFRTVAVTFAASRDYVIGEIAAARTAALADDEKLALRHLGQALHAVQDLMAHSNEVDLTLAERVALDAAVFDATKPMPAGLSLTSYVTTNQTENPTDDPANWTHGARAKDNATKNAEAKGSPAGQTASRYTLAMANAVIISETVLDKFAAGLAAGEMNEIQQFVSIDQLPSDAMYQCIAAGAFTPGSDLTVGMSCGASLTFYGDSMASPQTVEVRAAPLNVFRESEHLDTPDGRFVGLLREVQPMGVSILHAGYMEVAFGLDEVPWLDPQTLRVYYFDPESRDWTHVSASSVSAGQGGAVASFDILATGVYGIGGLESSRCTAGNVTHVRVAQDRLTLLWDPVLLDDIAYDIAYARITATPFSGNFTGFANPGACAPNASGCLQPLTSYNTACKGNPNPGQLDLWVVRAQGCAMGSWDEGYSQIGDRDIEITACP